MQTYTPEIYTSRHWVWSKVLSSWGYYAAAETDVVVVDGGGASARIAVALMKYIPSAEPASDSAVAANDTVGFASAFAFDAGVGAGVGEQAPTWYSHSRQV